MSLGHAIWLGIQAARNIQRIYAQGIPRRGPTIKEQVTHILANSIRINASAVTTGITNSLAEEGIDINDLSKLDPSLLDRSRSADLLQIKMAHVLLKSRDWMESAAAAIEADGVRSWMKKSPYRVPESMQIDNFTLCDPDLPKTVAALKQVIYALLCILVESGFRNAPWEQVAINPCFRGMLGIEDPDEYIITAIEGKKASWDFNLSYKKALHEILDEGSNANIWWIIARKP